MKTMFVVWTSIAVLMAMEPIGKANAQQIDQKKFFQIISEEAEKCTAAKVKEWKDKGVTISTEDYNQIDQDCYKASMFMGAMAITKMKKDQEAK